MGAESSQKRIARTRAPRVQLEYEVYIGDAMKMVELPFVVGVLGDFSGKPEEPLPPLKERKFVTIDRDNFHTVLKGCAPRLAFNVADKLSGDPNAQLKVQLKFEHLDDFSPERVVQQVEPLRRLLETRDQLQALLSRLDGNDKGVDALNEIIQNTELRERLAKEVGAGGQAGGTPEG